MRMTRSGFIALLVGAVALSGCGDESGDGSGTAGRGGVGGSSGSGGAAGMDGAAGMAGMAGNGSPDCGNGAIDSGEACDGSNLNGTGCVDLDPFVDGDLGCDSSCQFVTNDCVSASVWIQTVLDEPDSSDVTLPVSKAVVTDTRPEIGGDPAGFFVQAEQQGPALFIAIDPTALDADPDVDIEIGDSLQFDVTAISTRFGTRFIDAISDFSVLGQGGPAAADALVQDVSGLDATTLVDGLDGFVSELVLVTGAEIEGSGFAFAGSGNQAALLFTPGIPSPGDDDFQLRIDETLIDPLDLAGGCVVTVESPMWRFTGTAQVSVYKTEDLTIESCPAPVVVGAVAVDSTSVSVEFDRFIDGASVDPSDFTFDNGLVATAAAIDGTDRRKVIVTTSTQSTISYTLTVATLTDTLGEAIDPTANDAVFTGLVNFGAQLYITEVDSDTADETQEFVELWNNTGVEIDLSVAKHWLLFINGNGDIIYRAVQLTGTLPTGNTYLVGNTTSPAPDVVLGTSSIQNGADGVVLVACGSCLDADSGFTEFPIGGDVGTALTFLSNLGATATKVDAIAYDTNDSDDADLIARCYPTADFPQLQFNEDANAARETDSLSRTSPLEFVAGTPSPGSFTD